MQILKSIRATFFTIFALQLSACRVAGSQRPAESAPDSTVMTYFVSEQYAIDTPGANPGQGLSDGMSSLFGIGLVAPVESTFSNWSSPTTGCMYSERDGLNFEPKRVVDIGSVKISGYGLNEVEIPKNEKSLTFSASGRLSGGTYELNSSGINGNLSFKQSFLVPNPSTEISIQSGTHSPIRLPSPRIPASSDPDARIVIDKSQPILISFIAPPAASYLRVRISDGTHREGTSVTCYAPLDAPLSIPAVAMNYFRSTDDGVLFVDFVSTSVIRDIPRIKESLILSYVRHIHGLIDFQLEDQSLTGHFGVLRFE